MTHAAAEGDGTADRGTSGGLFVTGGGALVASVVRTFVPILVGYVVAAFTKIGVPVNADDVTNLVNGLVSFGIAAAYYLIVRVLETFANSKFGWLLGGFFCC